ncbi:MspA family porin [Nocardia sp. NEAU-G5]|uniref:MspA family porin n=1 Tax=Nocardia albiluteola TaxID=2842303 RepID=A0ABS6ASG0_9NOCA|nr:MspA family porin [Nocardia albiluteola]MBU3060962.1 MspA family porin [Nocardia albiluteola]
MKTIRMGAFARLAGIGATAVAAVGLLSTGAANADTFVPLPDSHITQTMGDGTVVHVDITGESANINPSMVATPLSRNTWTSGHAQVNLTGGAAGDPKTSTHLIVGYIVGCQVDLSGGMTNGVGASATADPSSNSVSATGTGSTTLTLAAGQAKELDLLDIEQPDDFGVDSHYSWQSVPGPHQSLTWHDEQWAVDGCGGYAQARSFAQAKVYTNSSIGYVTVYGKPFSIG